MNACRKIRKREEKKIKYQSKINVKIIMSIIFYVAPDFPILIQLCHS